jgi:hypothetical protein
MTEKMHGSVYFFVPTSKLRHTKYVICHNNHTECLVCNKHLFIFNPNPGGLVANMTSKT